MSDQLDDYHAHEALDRCSMLADVIEQQLLNHPYVRANTDVFSHVSKAVGELCTAYQLIGTKHL